MHWAGSRQFPPVAMLRAHAKTALCPGSGPAFAGCASREGSTENIFLRFRIARDSCGARPAMTRFAAAVLVLIGCATLACNRDPVARARELERKADAYAARQQWKEAVIEYSNAIKATPNAAGLHDKRAHAYGASGDARAAYAG